MVFSQTSHKTQSVLKVVEIDRLKAEKSQQVHGSTGLASDEGAGTMPTSPMPTTSFSEGYLKEEPLFENAMFHDTDCEFFQDLVQWCSAPAKEEQAQTIDPPKKNEDRACNNDTLHTPLSPQGWDVFDVNSSYQTGFYNTKPVDPLSPSIEGYTQFNQFFTHQQPDKVTFQEQFLDISKLPVVLGDLTPGSVPENPWLGTKPTEVTNTYDTNCNKMYTHNTLPFIDQDDSFDSKFISVTPREVESSNNNFIISEYIIHDDQTNKRDLQELGVQKQGSGLSVDVGAHPPAWPTDTISTPEVLSYVEQLEKEKCSHTALKSNPWTIQEPGPDLDSSCSKTNISSPAEYEPITPKSESHAESESDDIKSHLTKRRHENSEDSDETYTPYTEQTNRKYKRRKPSVPIKDMILALEGSQQLTKARRGRPPKRRESTVSSVCSVDENSSSMSNHENKYRELRDKNNEASKRSRMNRKLKELQMEQLADELEERNKKLKVKAEILEEMTKKLKDALMTAILQK